MQARDDYVSTALGPKFDVRDYHTQVLEDGVITASSLISKVLVERVRRESPFMRPRVVSLFAAAASSSCVLALPLSAQENPAKSESLRAIVRLPPAAFPQLPRLERGSRGELPHGIPGHASVRTIF